MNEAFMKFLSSLGGGTPTAGRQIGRQTASGGGYNPSLQVKAGGGAASAAPWWARTAFAGNRDRVMEEGLLGQKKAPSTSKYAAAQSELQQKALEQKFSTFDKTKLPGSFTNERERVAQKIAQASQKWKIPGMTTQPASKIDKFKSKENYAIMEMLERDKKFQDRERLKLERRNAASAAARKRANAQNYKQRPTR